MIEQALCLSGIRRYLRRRIVFAFMLTVLFLSACQTGKRTEDLVKVIRQAAPQTTALDKTPFRDVGCIWQSEDFATCENGSVFKKLGCDSILSASPFLSLLEPQLPLVMCSYAPLLQEVIDEQAEGLYSTGCMLPTKMRVVVFQDGNYRLIQNHGMLQAAFAPIESPEEALGYAIAATGMQPLYNFEASPDFRYLVDEIPETVVETLADGYEVLLYDYQLCGCGPHPYSIAKVKVSFDGTLAEAEAVPAYEDSQQDGLCID